MNIHLKEALLKQQTRNNFKNIARNKIDEADLYTTFVEPFTDIVKATGLATQDIVSSLTLVAGTILTLSPKKQEKRLSNFRDRQKKIEAKWKPLMDKATTALSTGDADILAFTFAPGLYFASSLGTSAYNAAEGIGGFLDVAGLKGSILSLLPGVSEPAPFKPEKDEKSLLDKLNTLFLGTAVGMSAYASYKQSQQAEQERRGPGTLLQESSNFSSDFNEYLDDSGLDSEIEKTQNEFINHYSEIISEFDKVMSGKTALVKAIKDSVDYADFVEALNKIDKEGTEITDEANKVEAAIKDGVEKLKDKKEFIQQLEDETESSAGSLSSDDIEKAAANVVFANIKSDLDKQLEKSVNELKALIGKDLKKVLPSDETLQMIKKTKAGIKLYNMIQVAKNRYIIS